MIFWRYQIIPISYEKDNISPGYQHFLFSRRRTIMDVGDEQSVNRQTTRILHLEFYTGVLRSHLVLIFDVISSFVLNLNQLYY